MRYALFKQTILREAAVETGKERLTLDLAPSVRRRLEAVAVLKGVSVRHYCLAAIGKELGRDEANGVPEQGFSREVFERLVARRGELFGGQPLVGDSVEMLREAREIRDAQLKDIP